MSAPTKRQLKAACEALGKVDDALAKAYNEISIPTWRRAEPNYATLGRLVAYQQISTKAAAAIWARVTDTYGDDVNPLDILRATENELRACGLSGPKIKHLKSIAAAIDTGALCFDRLRRVPREDARQELLVVKGIGPWTAELYFLYVLGEMDAFPTSDVGLMEAHKLLSGAETRMTSKEFTAHADRWQPHRGVAAHLLWGYLNHQRAKAEKAGSTM